MATLSPDDVRHIAKLARLHLSEEEVAKFTKELTSILEYIDRLQKVDTEGVEPLKQVTGMNNSYRDDSVSESEAAADALLETSPLPIVHRQIETPSAHG